MFVSVPGWLLPAVRNGTMPRLPLWAVHSNKRDGISMCCVRRWKELVCGVCDVWYLLYDSDPTHGGDSVVQRSGDCNGDI